MRSNYPLSDYVKTVDIADCLVGRLYFESCVVTLKCCYMSDPSLRHPRETAQSVLSHALVHARIHRVIERSMKKLWSEQKKTLLTGSRREGEIGRDMLRDGWGNYRLFLMSQWRRRRKEKEKTVVDLKREGYKRIEGRGQGRASGRRLYTV